MSRETAFQAYLDKVQAQTGRTPAELVAEAKTKGLTRSADVIAWLTADYGLGLGHARAIDYVIQHGPAYTFRSADGSETTGELVLDGKPRSTARP